MTAEDMLAEQWTMEDLNDAGVSRDVLGNLTIPYKRLGVIKNHPELKVEPWS
jgi:hypothetical protein